MTNARHFVTNGGENSVQDTISKLKFIAKIQKGEKVDVDALSIHQTSYLLSFIRTLFRNESRDKTITFIRTTYGESFEIIEDFSKNGDQFNNRVVSLLLETIQTSIKGLQNLIDTYHEDRMFVAKVETILETVVAKLEDFNLGEV